MKQITTEDEFESLFNGVSPEADAVERGRRERRQPGRIERRHPAWRGERVQFNLKVQADLKARVVKACKRNGISQTDALEEALSAWLTQLEGGKNA
jgi:hypothetical protein